MTIDDVMGTRPTTAADQARQLALLESLSTALAAQVEPTPSGPLYAIVMAAGYTLPEYEAALGVLIRVGALERDSLHRLTWRGPR